MTRASFTVVFLVVAPLIGPRLASAQSIDRARQLFAEAKFAEARHELAALERLDAKNAEVAYYLGRVATVLNEPEEAMRQFERATQLADSNALYHYWLGSAVRELTPYVKLKMPFYARRLKKEFDRAVELDPDHLDARFGLVQFYASAPRGFGGNRSKAREQAAEIEKRSPMRGAIARAFIAEMEANLAHEEAAYTQAIAAQPDSIAGYAGLAAAYAREGKATEAFATLERYSQRRPDDRSTSYFIGRIAAITGQEIDRGEAALQLFLSAPPAEADVVTIADAHYRLGQINQKRGVIATAREQFATAVKLNPRSPAKKALEELRK